MIKLKKKYQLKKTQVNWVNSPNTGRETNISS
jgi:hypothetical protein